MAGKERSGSGRRRTVTARGFAGRLLRAALAVACVPGWIVASAGTSPADTMPSTPAVIPGAGISLSYPSDWTPIPLTRHALAAQVAQLATVDPAKAARLQAHGPARSGEKFVALDLAAESRGGVVPNVGVSVLNARLLPRSLDRVAAGLAHSFERFGAVEARGRRRIEIDGVPAVRQEFDLTLGRKMAPAHYVQLLIGFRGTTRVLVTVATEKAPGERARADGVIGSVRVVGRPAPNAGPLQFRPVLAALPSLSTSTAASSRDATEAIASCDVDRLAAVSEPIPNTDPTPDSCVVLPFESGQGSGRLYLGPVRLTTLDLKSAAARFERGAGYVIDLDLTKHGLAEFNRLAAESYPKIPPQNSVAIIIGGRVYSNPRFDAQSFSGSIQFSGSFTMREAASLARQLNQAILKT